MAREERMRSNEGNCESKLDEKLLSTASQHDGIKMDVAVVLFIFKKRFS